MSSKEDIEQLFWSDVCFKVPVIIIRSGSRWQKATVLIPIFIIAESLVRIKLRTAKAFPIAATKQKHQSYTALLQLRVITVVAVKKSPEQP